AGRRPRWMSSPVRPHALEAARICDGFHIRMRLHPFHVIRIKKCVLLQTGMRGAFGKPQAPCRVHIGQVIMSALRRAKFKLNPCLCSRPQIHISKKYGFTKFNACDFDDMMAEKGPLARWRALHAV
uniref:Ribosomal protein L10 n=1 Tax=Maylandia zebra TaxID=106582 RepID=A0A3P9DTK1_9CICH